MEDFVDLQKTADDFLKIVKSLIEQFGYENVLNSDQSDFQLEIHFRRSLSYQEVKKIEQFIASITHSYTIWYHIMKICCHLYLLY